MEIHKQPHTCERITAWLTFILLLTHIGSNQAFAQRDTRTLNDSWKFQRGECIAAQDSAYDDSGWSAVHLPHTWNTDAYTVKEYYQGCGWYRRSVTLPQNWEGKQVFLKLDGASKAADVYVNGKLAGKHAGGYTAFCIDITPYVSCQGDNTIAIRVDNARQDIPPTSADFTFFGGIYRDVWLTAVPKQHFQLTDHASDGIFITTPQVSEEEGTIAIRGEVKNDADTKASLELVHAIYHPDGTLLQTRKQTLQLKGGETYTFRHETKPIAAPLLWTPETPHLYRVETTLLDRKTQTVLDQSNHHTAFRWFRFDGNEGFFLNGHPYKLRGICRHQDQKPIGVALTDEMHRRDFRLMKEMGANFIRISHYPQDDALLEMCDKLGMLAWEEIPIINIVPETEGFAANCEQNLREMIRQHYNHPSVIIWGYMNEILLATQRTYKTEAELKPTLERTLALANRLEEILREEDSTRLSAMAFHGSNSYNETGLGDITHVVGWNLYQGWYGGDLTGFERFLEEQHRKYPTHPMIVSEYGAGSDKRLHSLAPQAFDFSSEYQQKYLEHYVPVLENTPYVCGGSHWNFIDFGSASRDESMPRINNKGLTYADRTPKDVYYYYQAAWRNDLPVLHIASRDWNRRAGIQEEGKPVMLPVKVYTNLPEAELFINGTSVGKKRAENFHILFDVPFDTREAFLFVQGEWQGKRIQDGIKVDFTPTPAVLTAENLQDAEVAVNVGSQCFFTSDESQLTWLPDRPYSEGGWGYLGGKEQNTQAEIQGTNDGPLFQTQRSGLEGYRFDVPAGTYEVELLFADILQNTTSTVYLLGRGDRKGEGANRFTLTINGEPVEDSLAPGSEAGSFHALRKRYCITTSQPYIDLRFHAEGGTSFLNGIKLRRLY